MTRREKKPIGEKHISHLYNKQSKRRSVRSSSTAIPPIFDETRGLVI